MPVHVLNSPSSSAVQNDPPRREAPSTKRARLDSENLSNAIAASLETHINYEQAKSFQCFNELKMKLKNHAVKLGWSVIVKESCTVILLLKDDPNPTIVCCVKITSDLNVLVYHNNVQIKFVRGKSIPKKVNNLNEIDNLIESCHEQFFNKEFSQKSSAQELILIILTYLDLLREHLPHDESNINFFKQQISFLNICKNQTRYSADFLVFCSLFRSISPHAYNFFRNSDYLRLPCRSVIKSYTNTLQTNPVIEQNNLLRYITSKFNILNAEDKSVILLMDEVHLKPDLDYKGGEIVGAAFDGTENASSAFVFMINSLKSLYKDVVHILPVRKINANILHSFLKAIIIGLENIGFEVMGVVTDNHSINRKCMSLFSDPPQLINVYPHPNDSTKPMFFWFDSVHIIKCIRNNWINEKNQEMICPDFADHTQQLIASFSALKEMHALEKNSLIKYGFGLTLKALYPTSIERQNVKLALKVFNSNNVAALSELGPKKNFTSWKDTSAFIEIICKWWDIVNVKTPFKGVRLRNPFQEPITADSHNILEFLNTFLSWLQSWNSLILPAKNRGKLTSETFCALKFTTEGLIKFSDYWIREKGNAYFLPGKIQTDNLEDRFGKYRQLAGAQYHVSLRQIFESEAKLRMQSVLPLILKSSIYGSINLDPGKLKEIIADVLNIPDSDVLDYDIDFDLPPKIVEITVDDDDIESIHMWPIITFIAGYCSFACNKKIKCQYCETFFVSKKDDLVFEESNEIPTSFITAKNRGGLQYPSYDVVRCFSIIYIIVTKLISGEYEKDFLALNQHKNVIAKLGLPILENQDIFLGHQCSKHNKTLIFKHIVSCSVNTLLNNYVRNKNDVIVRKNMPQCKRVKPT